MIRPLRQSVSLRNISASQDVNGKIRELHTNHPIYFKNEDYTRDDGARVRIKAGEHALFREMIDQHPATRSVTNTELRAGFSIPIVSQNDVDLSRVSRVGRIAINHARTLNRRTG